MPLSPTTPLTAHFLAGELRADHPAATPGIIDNLTETARRLEVARAVLGVPLRVTSGFRPPDYNATVGGSTTSDHMTGKAADVVPLGLTLRAAYDRLTAASSLGAWDQIIYYPVQGHIHFGYGDRNRREVRIQLSPEKGGTPILTSDLISRLGDAISVTSNKVGAVAFPTLALLLAVFLVAFLLLA